MAAGRPVLLAARGEAADLVRRAECGLVVPPGDPAALAGAITQLATDHGLAACLGAAGRRYVELHHARAVARPTGGSRCSTRSAGADAQPRATSTPNRSPRASVSSEVTTDDRVAAPTRGATWTCAERTRAKGSSPVRHSTWRSPRTEPRAT